MNVFVSLLCAKKLISKHQVIHYLHDLKFKSFKAPRQHFLMSSLSHAVIRKFTRPIVPKENADDSCMSLQAVRQNRGCFKGRLFYTILISWAQSHTEMNSGVIGMDFTMHTDCTPCIRSNWPPCCCSSSQDNTWDCVNAASSEGEEQGNSGQGGLTGGLLSDPMCIRALLAANRFVEWGNIRGNHSRVKQIQIIRIDLPSKGQSWWSCRPNMCLCREASSCRCFQVTFRAGFCGAFQGNVTSCCRDKRRL